MSGCQQSTTLKHPEILPTVKFSYSIYHFKYLLNRNFAHINLQHNQTTFKSKLNINRSVNNNLDEISASLLLSNNNDLLSNTFRASLISMANIFSFSGTKLPF